MSRRVALARAIALDPMMGNGGILKVAKGLNRKAIGIDKDKDSDCVEIAKSQNKL